MKFYCIHPNLGSPAIVSSNDLSFAATIALDEPVEHPGFELQGKLFLQLPADTRKVVQDIATRSTYVPLWNAAAWPQEISDGLIPLEIIPQGPCVEKNFSAILLTPPEEVMKGEKPYDPEDRHRRMISCSCTAPVLLRIPSGRMATHKLPQLFNLVRIREDICIVNFHAVYISQQDWTDFSILHITDTHLAWRNDFIQRIVEDAGRAEAGLIERFNNFNRNFRRFITDANCLHRKREADVAVLTGDIVDYIEPDRKFNHFDPGGLVYPADNFQLLLQLVTGWPASSDVQAGEELEIPLFICPGNHDYRKREYALAGDAELARHTMSPINEFGKFGLSYTEAMAYENDRRSYPLTEVGSWVDPVHEPDPSFLGLISSETDHAPVLGKHRILCMDTGYDAGAIGTIWDLVRGFFSPDPSTSDFMAAAPDCIGFSHDQIRFINDHAGTGSGLTFLACHAPVLDNREDTNYFYFSFTGPRDPDFSRGVATNNFNRLADIIFQDQGKRIDLILCGHTHRYSEIQFKPDFMPAEMETGLKDELEELARLRSLNMRMGIDDAAIAQRIKEIESQLKRWYRIEGDIYSGHLANAIDKAAWWAQQPVLQVQTPSLAISAPFGMLRIVVERDVIIRIDKLDIR